jgi:uracil-DNA glycosylase
MIVNQKLHPLDLLAFYVEGGVDESIGLVPVNRFVKVVKPKSAAAPVLSPASSTPSVRDNVAQPTRPISSYGEDTTRLAQSCETLEQLRKAMEDFQGLASRQAALSTVFSDGNPNARVMLVGEAPGHEEEVEGRPFVGRNGKMLDQILASIGLSRAQSAYLTTVMPWPPLGSPLPSTEEIAVCKPFLLRHIQLVAPRILVLLGGIPASTLFELPQGTARMRGIWQELVIEGVDWPIAVMPTFHPSYLLTTPDSKKSAWSHMLDVKKRLESL